MNRRHVFTAPDHMTETELAFDIAMLLDKGYAIEKQTSEKQTKSPEQQTKRREKREEWDKGEKAWLYLERKAVFDANPTKPAYSCWEILTERHNEKYKDRKRTVNAVAGKYSRMMGEGYKLPASYQHDNHNDCANTVQQS